ncbi:UDP-N-acetylmuramoyl-tripeptide--D-alanyl-D-alanine ligase [Blattabacterium cuenoti]|uniref:UDP-N-acetylmuramoyl-tripeptide--D-alanyl-D- alanine ligase n=1 Tax=Blattabacterium cuenoti TaxID=1653831 RepID=UPI00163B7527|nr:UDP-N-acetylmuramoyl-tripeptide--D-alanyl-D-alanine ligase [Blattabacterium cuenoti]
MNLTILEKVYKKYKISSGVEINSKKVKEGSIFISLKGERYDGNCFASEAISNGAVLAIMDNDKYNFKSEKIIFVKNALSFLHKLAYYHRIKNAHIPTIAIVGSNGKTTTKEITKLILSKKYEHVHSTFHNMNNHIGVPLTILSMPKKTQISLIEIGASHEKEIEKMCSIVNPDYGYITSFGKAHLEGFYNIQGIIKSKLELYNFLREHNKLAFINGDDPIQMNNSKNLRKFIFSSKIKKPDVLFKYFYNEKKMKNELTVNNTKIISSVMGEYNLCNIASSITLGIYFKVPLFDIKKAVEEYIPNNYRLQLIKKNKKNIIIDCYNANPTSMMKSLIFFESKKGIIGNKAVVLGDMLELGPFSNQEHEKIVDFIEKSHINYAFLIGKDFFKTKKTDQKIKKFINKNMFLEWIKKNPMKNIDFVLIKGSRKVSLESIISFI